MTTYDNRIVLESPIFGIDYIKGYIIAICGGGGKKFGVRNYLQIHKINKEKIINEPVYKLEYENRLPLFIKTFNKHDCFCVCFEDCTIFYNMDISSGQPTENREVKGDKMSNLSIMALDHTDSYISSGGSFGELQLYSTKISGNSLSSLNFVYSKHDAHNDKFTDLLVLKEKFFIISASMDQTCKVFDFKSNLKLVHCLSFKPSITSDNYIFRNVILYNGCLYTLQSPMKGSSFVTKWRLSDFSQIHTVNISDTVCSRMRRCGRNLVIGQVNGRLMHVDADSLEINFIGEYHLMDIKSIAVVDNSICYTASPDQMIASHKIKSKSLLSIWGILKLLIVSVIIYALIERIKNMDK